MTRGVTGVVLAGGLGRRMGGADKGLLDYGGRPLAQQVAERLAPQVETLLINANRNREAYTALGYPVIDEPDRVVEAIFKHYEARSFAPLPNEREMMLNL